MFLFKLLHNERITALNFPRSVQLPFSTAKKKGNSSLSRLLNVTILGIFNLTKKMKKREIKLSIQPV
jgi:hypothetical protein